MDTKDFGLVGIASDTPLDPDSRVLVRVREDGVWTEWTPLSVHDDHGPDPDSAEASRARFGTDPLLTGDADGVQVRIDTPDGVKPTHPSVVLLDSPVTDEDAELPMPDESTLPVSTVAAATVGAPMPPIITRAMWGADESKRSGSTKYAGTIKAAFIHHTASTNNYTPEEAAKQVRNLYQWFTKGLNYSDMAYNFLIDRFGRLYEGRGGGMDQAVVGGHTAGFNVDTFAVSAIGDFRSFRPDAVDQAAINESLASLIAWKLSLFQRDPNGTTVLTSDSGAGTSKYKPGQQATALVVGGHGDIGSTSCPGAVLRSQIPTIRAMAASKIGVTMFNPAVAAAVPYGAAEAIAVNASTTAPLAWSMTVRSKCGDVVRSLSGQQEAGGPLSVGWDKLNDAGQPVPPGDYTLTLSGASGADATYPWTGTARVLPTVDSPPDPCAAPSEFTVNGAGWGHGVGMSQWGAYGMAKAGYDAAGIATYYYTGTAVTPVQDDMDARINLLYQVSSAKVRAEPLDPSGGAIEVTVGPNVTVGGPLDEFRFGVDGPNVTVKRVAGGQTADLGTAPSVTVRWAGTRTPGGAAGGPTLLNVVGGSSLDSSGHRYRYGSVELVPVSTSGGVKLNVVNSVRVHDEYLYGISEVSSSWPAAAMQAQVLAARTYALSKVKRGVRQACSCNMDDGGGPYYDQTFTGLDQGELGQGRPVGRGGQRHAGLRHDRPGDPVQRRADQRVLPLLQRRGDPVGAGRLGRHVAVRRERARPVDGARGQPEPRMVGRRAPGEDGPGLRSLRGVEGGHHRALRLRGGQDGCRDPRRRFGHDAHRQQASAGPGPEVHLLLRGWQRGDASPGSSGPRRCAGPRDGRGDGEAAHGVTADPGGDHRQEGQEVQGGRCRASREEGPEGLAAEVRQR